MDRKKRINELTTLIQDKLRGAHAIGDNADAEGRDYTSGDRTAMRALIEEATRHKAELEDLHASQELADAVAQLGETAELNPPSRKQDRQGHAAPGASPSVGEAFVTSGAYTALLASAPNGQFGEKMRVQSQPVGFKTLVTGSSDTSAGALVQPDWLGLQTGLEVLQRPLTLRDVVTSGTTGSDTIEYARVTSITNRAAPVAESTQTQSPADPGPATGVKPESALATQRYTAIVKTIAHWIPATKRALSDAPQIRSLIDAFLAYGLEEELEDQIILGDGAGENFTGLANTDGIQAQPYETNILTTLRKAKTRVQLYGRAVPNAYVINPADAEEIDLLTDNEQRFYFGGPSGIGTAQQLWGIPVIISEAVPHGTGYLGDWRRAVLWDRQQASLTVTDSHGDFFIRNMVAILAELRAAFGIIQPSAFIEIDMGGVS